MMMKRILAMMLALFLLAGTAAAGAEEANPYRADSYDFTLRFRLNAEAFPLHDREYMQGYADLLEALEFRGNYSQSMQGKYVDMSFEVVPVTNPDAAVSFRIFGRPKNWLNVSSSLLGDAAVCFQPPQIMPFVVRAWETFQIPLFPIALAIPTLTEAPYNLLYENWSTEVRERKDRSVIDRDTLQRIADNWRREIDTDRTITDWIAAASRPLGDGGISATTERCCLKGWRQKTASNPGWTCRPAARITPRALPTGPKPRRREAPFRCILPGTGLPTTKCCRKPSCG